MGRLFKWARTVIDGIGTISTVLGWLGSTALVSGILASAGGAVWAVIIGVPLPIVIMAAYCTFVAAVYLVLAPTIYRALSAPTLLRKNLAVKEPDYEAWRHVERLTLMDAACLWVGNDPSLGPKNSQQVSTWLTVLSDAAARNELRLVRGPGDDEFDLQHDMASPGPLSHTTRKALKEYAKRKGFDPQFLRDE